MAIEWAKRNLTAENAELAEKKQRKRLAFSAINDFASPLGYPLTKGVSKTTAQHSDGCYAHLGGSVSAQALIDGAEYISNRWTKQH